MRQQPMELIDGKFYRGKEEVKPEFGNKEQIALINAAEKRIEALKGDGLLVEAEHEIVYRSSLKFRCVCGQYVWKEDDDADSLKHISGLVGQCKCQRCRKTYEVIEDDGELYVKLIKS